MRPREACGRITTQSKRGLRSKKLASYATVSRTLNSSFQRRPSRATHQSCSIPVSVITVSNDTGTTSARRAVGRELHFDRRKLFEFVAEIFDQSARRIVLARSGAEEAELGRLVDDQAELAVGDAHFECLPPCRTARRQEP